MLITHNMKNKKLLLGIAWAWLTCLSANAEVKLPAFFSDGMVMQQQTRANLCKGGKTKRVNMWSV